jgi:thiol-disulfide isomerase/thioredoxin
MPLNPRWLTCAALLAATVVWAQSPQAPQAPAAPTPAAAAPTAAAPAPAPRPSPVSGIRNKVSAGDLLSAESILEVHRQKNGEDGPYLVGLSWLARGALLLGDAAKADRYVSGVRARCADSLARGIDLEKSHDTETALGAAIEVAAQRIQQSRGPGPAAAFLRDELSRLRGPVPLVSRLNKRLNLIALEGSPAPELAIDDFLGDPPPTLGSLRGKPVLLFLWAEWCADCRAQAAALAKVKARHSEKGLQVIALTRYYADSAATRVREKARVDSMWKADYQAVGAIPIVFSTASMERYGGSSTPTFVFVDRKGVVRRYTPTRLTEEEFDRTLETLVR